MHTVTTIRQVANENVMMTGTFVRFLDEGDLFSIDGAIDDECWELFIAIHLSIR